MPCETFQGATICRTEMEEVHRESEGIKWCFVCHKRQEFFYVVTRPSDPMSYYGPHSSIYCAQDHWNGDLFPGRLREWED